MPNVGDLPGEANGDGGADVTDRLHDVFANALHIRVPSDDTDLLASGLLDSLGLVELLFQVEQTFGLTIELEELEIEHFRSLRAISATVAAKRRVPNLAPRMPADSPPVAGGAIVQP